ncbi:MAG TPA: hypothetical protein VN258_04350 [Mobilitalea sp.]|nr:hypothetical protein [Mobilitalea sp.]
MLTEGKIKKVALLVALDISLKRMKRSPERCARNLMELGLGAYPDRLTVQERMEYQQKLLDACRHGDSNEVRECFMAAFL